MNTYINIPVTLSLKKGKRAFEVETIEESVKQFIDLMIGTRQGECFYNEDFGYQLWSNEFEPILNIQQWQPMFMKQIKDLLEKYEPRITAVQVREPEIKSINKKNRTDKDYRITLTLDYRIKQTGEKQSDVKVTFEY